MGFSFFIQANDLEVNVGVWRGETDVKIEDDVEYTYPNGWGVLSYLPEDPLNREEFKGIKKEIFLPSDLKVFNGNYHNFSFKICKLRYSKYKWRYTTACSEHCICDIFTYGNVM